MFFYLPTKRSLQGARLLCVAALLSLFSLVSPGSVSAAPQTRAEHVQAVFLYNLASFVNWPETWTEHSEYFTIGIVGDTPFGAIINQVVAGEQWRGKPMRVVHFDEPEEIRGRLCDILYIGSDRLRQFDNFKKRLEGLPILTVADSPGFLEMGGMINLVRKQQRLGMGVNLQAVRYSGLSISSKLLRLATIVE